MNKYLWVLKKQRIEEKNCKLWRETRMISFPTDLITVMGTEGVIPTKFNLPTLSLTVLIIVKLIRPKRVAPYENTST